MFFFLYTCINIHVYYACARILMLYAYTRHFNCLKRVMISMESDLSPKLPLFFWIVTKRFFFSKSFKMNFENNNNLFFSTEPHIRQYRVLLNLFWRTNRRIRRLRWQIMIGCLPLGTLTFLITIRPLPTRKIRLPIEKDRPQNLVKLDPSIK
jgi:hypothetical protein